jgi:uncharacterized protein YcnI
MTPWIRHRAALALSAACAAAAAPAAAHVTLAERQAQAGGYSRLTLQVPHGCAGRPTTGLAVDLPPGLASVKPMPKPGWTLAIEREPLATPTTLHGRPVTERVRRVRWEGGPLANEHFDEFVLMVRLPDAPGTLTVRTLQHCGTETVDWSGAADSETPAPALQVLPAAEGAHRH